MISGEELTVRRQADSSKEEKKKEGRAHPSVRAIMLMIERNGMKERGSGRRKRDLKLKLVLAFHLPGKESIESRRSKAEDRSRYNGIRDQRNKRNI